MRACEGALVLGYEGVVKEFLEWVTSRLHERFA
jgi:hypothetical protein